MKRATFETTVHCRISFSSADSSFWLKFAKWFWRRYQSIFTMVLKFRWPNIWTNLDSLHPKNALCQLPSLVENDIDDTTMTDDGIISIRKAFWSLWLSWAKNTYTIKIYISYIPLDHQRLKTQNKCLN